MSDKKPKKHKKPFVAFTCTLGELGLKIQELILDVAKLAADKDGVEKMELVVDSAAKWFDDHTDFNKSIPGLIAEASDRHGYKALLTLIAQTEFNALRKLGKV